MERSQIRWFFREGVNTIRFEGLHILSWRLLRWGLLPFGDLRAITYCRMDLTQPLREIQANVDLIISQATEADIDHLVALEEIRYSPKQKQKLFKAKSINETISEQFKQGSKCFIGKIGTEIVHYNWIFFNRVEYDHYFVQQSGFHTAYTAVLTFNPTAKKGLQRVGWDLYGTLFYFSFNNSNKVLMWQLHPPLDPFIPVK